MSGIITTSSLVALPVQMRCHVNQKDEFDYKAILQSRGFVFSDDETDYCNKEKEFVKLPKNWRLTKTDSPLVNIITDDKGRYRGSVHDYLHSSWIELFTKYDVMIKTKQVGLNHFAYAEVWSDIEVVYTTNNVVIKSICPIDRYEAGQSAKELAHEWLNQNFPDWKNPGAYWN